MDKQRHHEYATARDFMKATGHLIDLCESKKILSRPLINLAFLSLEISIKALTKTVLNHYRRVHAIGILLNKLREKPKGRQSVEEISNVYKEMISKLKLPPENAKYSTFDELADFLTKDEFTEWRYTIEKEEKLLFAHQEEQAVFPFLNVYFITYLFQKKIAEQFGDPSFPNILHHKQMPYYFTIVRDNPNDGSVVFEAFLSEFIMAFCV